MTDKRWSVAVAALAIPLLAMPASAAAPNPERIDLPDGWQPEGITTDRTSLYAGSLADGAIWKANPRTGNGRIVAAGKDGRVAVGIDYDFRRDLIWVAGGETKRIRAHDARTGRVQAAYRFPKKAGRFLNDLVVTRKAVYATDSFNQQLAVVPFRKDGSLRPPKAARVLRLTGALEYTDGFNLNGIVKSRGWLLAVQTNTGELFRINPRTGRTRLVDLGGETLLNGDGLEIKGDTLYVVRNQEEVVVVLDLNRRRLVATKVGELSKPDLTDVPTTAALVDGHLFVVNARFGTEPTPDTEYWITRMN